jgi:hypothetical protein
MSKTAFSNLTIVKKRLGKDGDTDWDQVFEQMAMSARAFIVSQLGWDPEHQTVTEYVDGYGEKPVILKHGNMTDLTSFALWDGTVYNDVDTLPRWFDNGLVDFTLPRGFKVAKVVYTAGWTIAWDDDDADTDNETGHNFPEDLEELSNKLISKMFLRKAEVDIKSKAFEGASTTYKDLMDPEDKAVIKHYKRLWT